MQIRFTKGFVRQSRGVDGKPAFMLLLVVEGEVPPGLCDEHVIVGKAFFEDGDVTVHVDESAKAEQFAAFRADQIICSL